VGHLRPACAPALVSEADFIAAQESWPPGWNAPATTDSDREQLAQHRSRRQRRLPHIPQVSNPASRHRRLCGTT
jgi:hypothetical protein